MVKFSSFLGGNKSAKLHTNGIAKVGSKSIVGGSTSPESFAKRQHIAKNRQVIGGFKQSGVANGYRSQAMGALTSSRISDRAARTQRFDTSKPAGKHSLSSARPAGAQAHRPTLKANTSRFNPYK